MSVRLSVHLSVRLSLKISVTTEPIGFYSSGNIPTGLVVVLGYFLGWWDTPNPPKNEIPPPPEKKNWGESMVRSTINLIKFPQVQG